jgi:hypothetical protein
MSSPSRKACAGPPYATPATEPSNQITAALDQMEWNPVRTVSAGGI